MLSTAARRPVLLASLMLALSLPSAALADSLPAVSSGHRPGPDLLYRPLADAPQLDNAPGSVWQASPILISGTDAYRRGEYLYQDYLYDDHGANSGTRDSSDPWSSAGSYSEGDGTYTYPSDRRYVDNLADLVEFRVKPLPDSTAFRITLDSMTDPKLVAATIAIGSSTASRQVPFGANASAPAQWFLTWHGNSADLRDATTGAEASVAPTVSVDVARRQVELRVPRTAWDPGTGVVRFAMGVGLWDQAHDRYLVSQQNRDTAHPGGAGFATNPEAFFNVAFRFHEPWKSSSGSAYLRDYDQAETLKTGDLSKFYTLVDFSKLAEDVTDESHIPASGAMDRILASHFETEQGVDFSKMCEQGESILSDYPYWYHCDGQLRGRLQPYGLYVPRNPMPASGYGLTLLLHGAASAYNAGGGAKEQSEYGERGSGSIVMTPEARGPDGFYFGAAEADVFEVWADVAHHYTLDPSWTAISGYSMGGYGTWKLADSFPDLFAAAHAVVGGEAQSYMLASLRNVPIMMWETPTDELSWAPIPANDEIALQQLGYRFEFDWFEPAEHLAFAFNDEWGPGAAYLGTQRVDLDPPHVTYVATPSADQLPSPSETNPVLDPPTTFDRPDLGLVHDHAYWLSDIRVRDPSVGVVPTASGGGVGGPPVRGGPNAPTNMSPNGVIDAFSSGFGRGDPSVSGPQAGVAVLTGGNIPAMAYARHYETWGSPTSLPIADQVDVSAKNVASATIDPARADVDCNAKLQVTTDGPLTVTLAGCNRKESFSRGRRA